MGNVKMQKIDLCVIQDHDLAQVFLDMDQRPAVKTVVVIDQIVPPNSPKVSALHKALREKAEKEGLDFYYGKGMCAELLANGLLKADESAVVCVLLSQVQVLFPDLYKEAWNHTGYVRSMLIFRHPRFRM